MKEYLLELKAKNLQSEFICEGFAGGMLKYDGVKSGLRRICKRLGVKRITPHEMRHSATDLYYTAGASTEDLRRLLNHSSTQTTKIYIHRTDKRLSEVANNITSLRVELV